MKLFTLSRTSAHLAVVITLAWTAPARAEWSMREFFVGHPPSQMYVQRN